MKQNTLYKLIAPLLLVLMVAATVTSCVKKGEEDPIISLRSRKARLAGDWAVQDITVSSQVSLMGYEVPGIAKICQQEFMNEHSISSYELNFDTDGGATVRKKTSHHVFNLDSCAFVDTELNIDQAETWQFNDDETMLMVSNDGNAGVTFTEFEIIGLSNNEMTLTYNVTVNFVLDEQGAIVSYGAPQVYEATMVLEKQN